jgi:hypothetical protein
MHRIHTNEGYYCKQIMDEWYYLTQMTDESKNFIQMTIFSQKSIWLSFTFEAWLHFSATSEYTLRGQLFCYFLLHSWFFEILDFFLVVVSQVQNIFGWWYSWLDHRGYERRNLIRLIKHFFIDGILDSDDLSFFGYNHLKSFVCCVWNIENLCDMFC